MARYNKTLVNNIINLIEEDNYTITEICRISGISRMIFYKWKANKQDFAQAVDEAIKIREDKIHLQARKSLRQKLDGYKQIETKTVYIPQKDNPDQLTVKEHVVKEKFCMPEISTIKSVLADKETDKTNTERLDTSKTPLVVIVKDEKTKENMELLQQRLTTEKNINSLQTTVSDRKDYRTKIS